MTTLKATTNFTLDDIYTTGSLGSQNKAIAMSLYGVGHQKGYMGLPPVRYDQGICLFTRPQLNLTDNNIRPIRVLNGLLGERSHRLYSYLRTILDPRLLNTVQPTNQSAISSPLTNNKQAFIPIMTNTLNAVSGFPDFTTSIYVGKPEARKEVYMQVDGVTEVQGPIDLTLTFQNIPGEPVLNLVVLWTIYMGLVYIGDMSPYFDFILENELDYNTRMFRIVFDPTGRYVVKIAATLPGIISDAPIGGGFDFSREGTNYRTPSEISLRLKVPKIEYNDPILIEEFNDTVVIFQPDMADGLREIHMTLVDHSIIKYFNHHLYMRINPSTLEMEYYIEKSKAKDMTDYYLSTDLPLPNAIKANK